MQKGRESHIVARSLFYWSKLFSGQLEVSESYKNLHRTISINILDFKLFEKDKRFWRKAVLLDKETNEQLTDFLELHFIELGKMKAEGFDIKIIAKCLGITEVELKKLLIEKQK